MKKILLFLIIGTFLAGCNKKVNELSYKDLMKEKDYIIVDVRTEEEFRESHIKDAINISYEKIDGSELDKNKNIFVYCRSGKRSKIAFEKLKNLGYEVYDLGAFAEIDLPKE